MQAVQSRNSPLFLPVGGCSEAVAGAVPDKITRRFETRHGSQSKLSQVFENFGKVHQSLCMSTKESPLLLHDSSDYSKQEHLLPKVLLSLQSLH